MTPPLYLTQALLSMAESFPGSGLQPCRNTHTTDAIARPLQQTDSTDRGGSFASELTSSFCTLLRVRSSLLSLVRWLLARVRVMSTEGLILKKSVVDSGLIKSDQCETSPF